jgi:hypothetical protein
MFAFIVIVIEIATDPIIEGGLSSLPQQYGTIILVVRFAEVVLVILAFFAPSIKDRYI